MAQKEVFVAKPPSTTTTTANRNSETSNSRNEKDNLAYLDDYLDTIEALPMELQRNFSLMRELDNYAHTSMEKVTQQAIFLINNLQSLTPVQRKEQLQKLGNEMNETLKNGEEKVSLATSTYDTVDRHIRRLDDDLQKFEDEQMTGPGRINATITTNVTKEETIRNKNLKNEKEKKETSRADRRNQQAQDTPAPKRRKAVKEVGTPPPTHTRGGHADKEREKTKPKARRGDPSKTTKPKTSKNSNNSANNTNNNTVQPNDMPIDPNEPVYCYCQQVSFGEMVACDNSDCKIEWFHYPCVELKAPPKGKWYCKECTEKLKKQRR
ncbi:9471_t:CDS:2 [Ambispora gerdemannii]|uniref:Chromatin modification-related protein n=1 Tax=Ambispora gerdemannii TaxID=144530 RepID=A0A9N8ZVV9_9GLOM|nr:9471_t:CDS:2 [Ambispora gerdemannii]